MATSTKQLTKAQVLKRMQTGDCPTLRGGYTYSAVFDDGARASHQTMRALMRDGLVDRPVGSSVYNRFSLVEASR